MAKSSDPDIPAAIYSYIQALRSLGRETTGAWEIASGLGLQVVLVERVLLRSPKKFPGVKLVDVRRVKGARPR